MVILFDIVFLANHCILENMIYMAILVNPFNMVNLVIVHTLGILLKILILVSMVNQDILVNIGNSCRYIFTKIIKNTRFTVCMVNLVI